MSIAVANEGIFLLHLVPKHLNLTSHTIRMIHRHLVCGSGMSTAGALILTKSKGNTHNQKKLETSKSKMKWQ